MPIDSPISNYRKPSISFYKRPLIAFQAAILLCFCTANQGLAQEKSGASPTDMQQMEDLATRVLPATVHVEVKRIAISTPEEHGEQAGYLISDDIFGSGTIISSDGLIVTNDHVIRGAQSVLVTLLGQDKPYKARIVGRDDTTDLALLKIDAATPTHFNLNAIDNVRYGEFVLAFGNPFGFDHSVSFGIVSSPQRETEYSDYRYIQTDAHINPGNSGGPLVDLRGNLIGINSLIYSYSGGSEGVGLALPLATVRRTIESIQKFGYARRAHFGFYLETISEPISQGLHIPRAGLLIDDVDLGGPAAKAGLESGDVLLKINEAPVNDFEDLDAIASGLEDNKPATLSILRDSQIIKLSVIPEFSPDPPSSLDDLIRLERDTVSQLGVIAMNYGEQLSNIYPHVKSSDGVVVAAKCDGTRQSAHKLELGDIVHAVNGHPVHNVIELQKKLEGLPTDEPLVLQLERNGHLQYVAIEDGDLR